MLQACQNQRSQLYLPHAILPLTSLWKWGLQALNHHTQLRICQSSILYSEPSLPGCTPDVTCHCKGPPHATVRHMAPAPSGPQRAFQDSSTMILEGSQKAHSKEMNSFIYSVLPCARPSKGVSWRPSGCAQPAELKSGLYFRVG